VRRAALASLLVLGSWLGCASPRPPPPPPPAAFYWEARSPAGGTLFLLGSVHVGDERELAPPLRVELDWARAQALVVEIDLHALPDLERLEAVQRYGLLPPERTLRDVVPGATWSALVSYLRARRYPLEAASRMRPWLLAQVIAQLEFAAAGYEPERGVDAWFLRRAVAEDKPVAQLESLDEQLAGFGALPASVEAALLRAMLTQIPAFLATTREILSAWERGDEARLLELLLGSRDDPALAAFHRAVFVERNQRMAARLAALADDGHARFVVVGTGHLIGPESIPELLAAWGFEVERHADAYVRVVPLPLPVPMPLPAQTPGASHP
jgi:uncharacterized protein YbaP (TraB family)